MPVLETDAGSPLDTLDMVIVGGCGHVGLPLALSFADAGCQVGIHDIDATKLERLARGEMPFMERGADELLARVLRTGRLRMGGDARMLTRTDVVVLVIGTPIDEFMNPSTRVFEHVIGELAPHLVDGSLVILRSTVYPGTTESVERQLEVLGRSVDVAFCPERIAEGYALEEMRSLPQIIGASTDRAFERARDVFSRLGVEVVRTSPTEAEMAKLFTNTWRYIKFAIANQFFQIAHSAGLDYGRVLHAVRHRYPRAADLPGPGFAAGPCLLKDTMQLAAFTPDHFPMGHAAMLVNEGLPNYIVAEIERQRPLRGMTLGILGMAFKGESDDPRTSLSYKLRKLAAFRGATVLCSDPYVRDDRLVPQSAVIDRSDVIVIGAPHDAYRGLSVPGKRMVDIWGVTGGTIAL